MSWVAQVQNFISAGINSCDHKCRAHAFKDARFAHQSQTHRIRITVKISKTYKTIKWIKIKVSVKFTLCTFLSSVQNWKKRHWSKWHLEKYKKTHVFSQPSKFSHAKRSKHTIDTILSTCQGFKRIVFRKFKNN